MTLSTASEKRLLADTAGKPMAIIPAREGSKRLKNKNKALINGKPLVLYAIEAAKESGVFDAIVVSSDDEEILEIAYENKVLPHKRAMGLAGDRVQVRHVCQYLLPVYGNPECFCVLYPTNPFRTPEDLNNAYNLFLEKDANYVMSVVTASPPPQLALKKLRMGWLAPWIGVDEMKQSQKLETLYRHDGSFIFAKSKIFLIEFDYKFYGSKVIPYFIEHPSVDIDTQDDLRYARYLMNER